MRAERHSAALWSATTICLFLAGCAGTGAPEHWLPVPDEAGYDPYGAWVIVEFEKPHEPRRLAGEFLAIDADSLYVLLDDPARDDPVVGAPLTSIKKARVAYFDPQVDRVVGWASMGGLMSLSHGLGAAISVPVWIIAGTAMASSQSMTPLREYPKLSPEEFRTYARFPQGPPPRLHGLGLRPKPRRAPMRDGAEDAGPR